MDYVPELSVHEEVAGEGQITSVPMAKPNTGRILRDRRPTSFVLSTAYFCCYEEHELAGSRNQKAVL